MGKVNGLLKILDAKKDAVSFFFLNNISRTKVCKNYVLPDRLLKKLESDEEVMDNHMRWNVDPVSGYKWKNKYFKSVRNSREGSEYRAVWELSRFHHFIACSDKENFDRAVRDWIKYNPYCRGINWVCAMEVAIRAVNWIVAYHYFRPFTDEFDNIFFESLHSHGVYIIDNLEKGVGGNHYLSDLIGLVYLGIVFPDEDWHQIGLDGIKDEVKKQIKDGVHCEGSTGYHMYVFEILQSIPVDDIKDSISKQFNEMKNFTDHLVKPDGTIPIIGDYDNGHLFGFPLYKKHEKNLSSKRFNNFFIMRDDDLYMIIQGGYKRQPEMIGHLHNDIFSFELYVGDKSFIIDPGTYTYTLDTTMRNKFRSTLYHNTVVVDSLEQNPFKKKGVLSLGMFGFEKYNSITEILDWSTNEDYDLFDAKHYGYIPVIHERKIRFDKNKKDWTISDKMFSDSLHVYELFYHLDTLPYKKKLSCIRTTSKGNNIEINLEASCEVSCYVEKGLISKKFGIKEVAPVIRYQCVGKNVLLETKIKVV